MKRSFATPTLLAAIVAVAGSAAAAVALVAIVRYQLIEGRALALVSTAYVVVGLWSLRRPPAERWVPRWALAAGVIFAGLEVTSICLEQFIGLPSPADAVVPASMMALMVLGASASAVVASAGGGFARGAATAVLVIGLGMLLSVSAVLLLVAVRTTSQPRMVPLLKLTCENATTHLTLPLLVAAIAGSLAAAISVATARHELRLSWLISVAGIAIFAVGAGLLVLAASLQRSERPPFVMLGMVLSALGLVFLPCVLGRRGRNSVA